MTISQNLQTIKNQIQSYEQKYSREKNSVTLLAASKKQPVEKLQEAIEAGQYIFGENYLQEALEKIEKLNNPKLEWHFIGPVQSNKTKKIAENFSWVHSVSDIKIAKRLNDQRPIELPPLNICIQINTSHELTKSGIEIDELITLANEIKKLPKIKLRGLMSIPEPKINFEDQRKEFHKLSEAAQMLRNAGISVDTLSMGMSHDLEAAIAEGATMVRIGTKIFGQRQ